jgi:hypothetical protein
MVFLFFEVQRLTILRQTCKLTGVRLCTRVHNRISRFTAWQLNFLRISRKFFVLRVNFFIVATSCSRAAVTALTKTIREMVLLTLIGFRKSSVVFCIYIFSKLSGLWAFSLFFARWNTDNKNKVTLLNLSETRIKIICFVV